MKLNLIRNFKPVLTRKSREAGFFVEDIVWSPGYLVSTVGLDEEQIKRYVKWQGDQDSGQAKLAF